MADHACSAQRRLESKPRLHIIILIGTRFTFHGSTMPKKSPKEPERKPWDRRPWPPKGDQDNNVLYASVGRSLSQWERLEDALSLLFSAFVSGHNSKAARRAYVAVRTFEGRAEMLRAASEIWFDSNSRPDLLTDFKAILSAITSYAPRRNDIAHGVVDAWLPEPATASSKLATGWALFPSYASFKDRDVKDLPKYCYTSTEIDYFEKEFSKLIEPVNGLASHLAELGLFKMGVIGMY